MNKFSFLIVVCSILFLVSCENAYVSLDDTGTYITDTIGPVDTIHFNATVAPIITTNCADCHFFGTDLDLESDGMYDVLIEGSFISVEDPQNSTFFTLPDPGHADDYLTPQEHITIVDWIGQGALNN